MSKHIQNTSRLAIDILITLALAALIAFIATYAVAVMAVYYDIPHRDWAKIGSIVTGTVFGLVIVWRFATLSGRRK
jgi:hypothetical protein